MVRKLSHLNQLYTYTKLLNYFLVVQLTKHTKLLLFYMMSNLTYCCRVEPLWHCRMVQHASEWHWNACKHQCRHVFVGIGVSSSSTYTGCTRGLIVIEKENDHNQHFEKSSKTSSYFNVTFLYLCHVCHDTEKQK